MQSAVILSSALLLAFLTAPIFSLPIAERSTNELQLIPKLPDQLSDSGLAKRDIAPNGCIDYLYIMAFTSGVGNGGADTDHEVSMRLISGETRGLILPNLPGDDYLSHKGDLWKLHIHNDFHFDGCIYISQIASIALQEHSNDGWNVDSIVTFFRDDHYGGTSYHVATMDVDVNRWIDGDGHHSHRRFELTLVI